METVTCTTAELADAIAALPLGQKATFIMESSNMDDLKVKRADTKEATPDEIKQGTKLSTLYGSLAGSPKTSDEDSYMAKINKARAAQGKPPYSPKPCDTFDNINHTALRVKRENGTIHAHLIIDPMKCHKVYRDADGNEIDKADLVPYFKADALRRYRGEKRDSGAQDIDEAVIPNYPTLAKIVEAHIGKKVYKVNNRKAMTIADLRKRLDIPEHIG